MKNIILVVTHKNVPLPEADCLKPIIVGKGDFEVPGALRDNTGNNISEKNPNYCELTALYWFWKNYLDYDNAGLCHYRRIFSTNRFSKDPRYYLNSADIDRILKRYDIILPEKIYFPCSTLDFLCGRGPGRYEDMEKLRNVLLSKYPECIPAYDYYTAGNTGSYYNMFVTSKPVLERYCSFLFDILSEVEKITDLSSYTPVEARIYGYLSEILMNIWVMTEKLKVRHMPVTENLDYVTGNYWHYKLSTDVTALKNIREFQKRK